MEIDRRTFLVLAAVGLGSLLPGRVEAEDEAESYGNIAETSLTNKRGETVSTRNFVGGDIFVVMSRKIRIKDAVRDAIYDLSFSDRGIAIAVIRAKTPIQALAYTTYPELTVSRSWRSPKENEEFTSVLEEQLRQAQIPGVACNVGCNMIHLAAFDARDIAQPNGTKLLQLLRIRNQRVIG